MKLAILSGASPKSFQRGSVIRLLPGLWRFHVHGLVDSKLAVDVEGYEHFEINDHTESYFLSAANVSPKFLEVGTEKSITVIAERINATNTTEH